MSIQSSVNTAMGVVAGGVKLHQQSLMQKQKEAQEKLKEQQQARVQQQKQYDVLKQRLYNYPTSLGKFGEIDRNLQKEIVKQDKPIQDILKKGKELEDKLNG